MNLHIISNSAVANDLIGNLERLNLIENNLIVVRDKKNNFVKNNPPCAPLYSKKFKTIVGNVDRFDKVFIHQFSPLMYRWVATNNFKQLNWIVWGADLYGIQNTKEKLYQHFTYNDYVKRNRLSNQFSLYNTKVFLTNSVFKNKAYAKVDHVLTWMNSEYEFAKRHIKNLKATHQYFMYGSEGFTSLFNASKKKERINGFPKIILGNSGTPTNNHIDSLKILMDNQVKANLVIPISYGDKKYISFLKDKFSQYTLGTVSFIEDFMSLSDYTNLLRSADALIMNGVRPQGFGNIFMMMLLGRPVFLNKRNYSLPDLNSFGIGYSTMEDLPRWSNDKSLQPHSVEPLIDLLSQKKTDITYKKIFS